MLILAVLWWICIQLAAPTWVYVILGFGTALRFFGGIIDFCKSIISLAEMGSSNKSKRK